MKPILKKPEFEFKKAKKKMIYYFSKVEFQFDKGANFQKSTKTK